jgi:type II secretory pathway predicted ATPase ExeA
MDAYQHFGLSKPPFDPMPDVEFFFDAPSHAEALATLQYVAFAGKACCVVVGESGYGKTLLARMVASSAGATTPVLWIHGCGQPDNETKITVFPAGRFGRAGQSPAANETTFKGEAHVAQFLPDPPLLIVDCADQLPAQGWRDVIGWLSNEIRYPKPVTVILLGSPSLLETLAAPEYVRLQRRVFRACRLKPFSEELSESYIRARIATAGGGPGCPFSRETLDEIVRLGQGNPALLNQLCDNALLEAYSEERSQVTLADVGNAVQAMFGGRLREQLALPAPLSTPFTRPALPLMQGLAPQCPSVAAHGLRRVVSTPISEPKPVELEDSVGMRLKNFESRLSRALSAVRQACAPGVHDGGSPPIAANDALIDTIDAEESRLVTPAIRVEADACP